MKAEKSIVHAEPSTTGGSAIIRDDGTKMVATHPAIRQVIQQSGKPSGAAAVVDGDMEIKPNLGGPSSDVITHVLSR